MEKFGRWCLDDPRSTGVQRVYRARKSRLFREILPALSEGETVLSRSQLTPVGPQTKMDDWFQHVGYNNYKIRRFKANKCSDWFDRPLFAKTPAIKHDRSGGCSVKALNNERMLFRLQREHRLARRGLMPARTVPLQYFGKRVPSVYDCSVMEQLQRMIDEKKAAAAIPLVKHCPPQVKNGDPVETRKRTVVRKLLPKRSKKQTRGTEVDPLKNIYL